jgi:hypothetical protein
MIAALRGSRRICARGLNGTRDRKRPERNAPAFPLTPVKRGRTLAEAPSLDMRLRAKELFVLHSARRVMELPFSISCMSRM